MYKYNVQIHYIKAYDKFPTHCHMFISRKDIRLLQFGRSDRLVDGTVTVRQDFLWKTQNTPWRKHA